MVAGKNRFVEGGLAMSFPRSLSISLLALVGGLASFLRAAKEVPLIDFDSERLLDFNAVVSPPENQPFSTNPVLTYPGADGPVSLIGGNAYPAEEPRGARSGRVTISSMNTPSTAGIRIGLQDGMPVNTLLLWDQSAFPPEYRSEPVPVGDGRIELNLDGSKFFLDERNSWGVRVVMRDGDDYYLSSSSFVSGQNTIPSLSEERWLRFDPTAFGGDLEKLADQVARADRGAFAPRTFEGVTAVGFWAFADRREYLNLLQVREFSTYVRIPEPSTSGLLILFSLLLLARRRG